MNLVCGSRANLKLTLAVGALEEVVSKHDKWVSVNSRNEDSGDESALHVAASRGRGPTHSYLYHSAQHDVYKCL
jgi:hypothetical protein